MIVQEQILAELLGEAALSTQSGREHILPGCSARTRYTTCHHSGKEVHRQAATLFATIVLCKNLQANEGSQLLYGRLG